jgi:hypothetical protein
MNKFTFIVEKDENKLTPEQELENFWNEFHGDKRPNEINNYEFYHQARLKGFEGELIHKFLEQK